MTGPILPAEKKGVGVLDVDDYYWLPLFFISLALDGAERCAGNSMAVPPSSSQYLLRLTHQVHRSIFIDGVFFK